MQDDCPPLRHSVSCFFPQRFPAEVRCGSFRLAPCSKHARRPLRIPGAIHVGTIYTVFSFAFTIKWLPSPNSSGRYSNARRLLPEQLPSPLIFFIAVPSLTACFCFCLTLRNGSNSASSHHICSQLDADLRPDRPVPSPEVLIRSPLPLQRIAYAVPQRQVPL